MNSYKVGDKLVVDDTSIQCDELFTVDRVGRYGEIFDSRWRMLRIEKFRYATQDEIIKGKRINHNGGKENVSTQP